MENVEGGEECMYGALAGCALVDGVLAGSALVDDTLVQLGQVPHGDRLGNNIELVVHFNIPRTFPHL